MDGQWYHINKWHKIREAQPTLEIICKNHVIGVSSHKPITKYPEGHQFEYCYGCTYDEGNQYCLPYQPIRVYRINVEE